jgi:hypothetical protein
MKGANERAGYAVVIEPLTDEEGGGFVATVPDLPGCMSDGDTRAEVPPQCRGRHSLLARESARSAAPFRSRGARRAWCEGKVEMTVSAKAVRFDDNSMWIDLSDGRTIGVSYARYPRLLNEREAVEIGRFGLHWEEIEEDISIAGLFDGRRDQTLKLPPK